MTTAAVSAKAYAFDVVSIRQNKTPATREVVAQDGPTADGYRSHQPLLLLLLTAYVPQVGGAALYSAQDQIKGLPDWVMREGYEVDARIADEDRAEWQKPGAQKRMLQSMLQALLADLCKLAVHREVTEAQVTSLVVAKDGPKFKETDPTVEHPAGETLSWGGVLVFNQNGMSFYDTSMASFGSFLSSLANQGHLVQDKTGLTGQYDFTLKFGKPTADEQQDDSTAAADPRSGRTPLASMILSGLNNLGLKLDSEKGQVETLVIDHMERPSEN